MCNYRSYLARGCPLSGHHPASMHRALAMAEPAFLCRLGFALPSGKWEDKALKAYGHEGSALKWEFRRLLPACGYDSTSRASTPCRVARQQDGRWNSYFKSLGLQLHEHFGVSARASMAQSSVAKLDLDAEQEYWWST
eukprot:5786650-Heterocapsa_arctica.AAC.1